MNNLHLYKDFFTSSKNHKFLTNIFSPNFTWNDVIRNIDISIQNNLSSATFAMGGIALHEIYGIKDCELVMETLKKNNPKNKNFSFNMYISLSKNSKSFGKHKDNSDVWVWQSIGKSKFSVFENSKEFQYTLNPGDFLYIPKLIFHKATPLSPRVSISFGIDYPVEPSFSHSEKEKLNFRYQ